MPELNGKVAIVTGAGRLKGIGRAAAVALARLGADVVITGTGRDPSTFPDYEREIGWRDVESVAELIREEGRKALPLVVDVTDEAQVVRMVEQTVSEFGRVDILVNNAAHGVGADRIPIVELEPAVFDLVVDVKVRGTYLCTRAAVTQMIEQGDGGKIVNIASVAGKRGSANTLAYNAANFAVVGMTQSSARELGPHGINVNCVCPGLVQTHRGDVFMDVFDRTWEQTAESVPIGRNGTDKELGDFVAYLCTEAASWIHGQSINVDGGVMMEH
ncbi:MAG: glucose 1-dehydrogenase [Dehalococcoidia bacterium]|nr:glucose 1-dehydrogenase [Dehalococcoidia bacterium]